MQKNDTARQSAEQKLYELEMIFSEAAVPMFVIDRNHKISHFNRACEILTGFTRDEMIGTDSQWKAFYSKKRPVLADLIVDNASESQIAGYYGSKFISPECENGRYTAEDYFPDLGDEGKWLYFTAAPIKDENGTIIAAVETLQDITEKKKASRQMRESERHYRMLLEFVPYPIVVYDREGKVSYINPAFTRTFGWTLEEISGRIVPFVPEDLDQETRDLIKRFYRERSLKRYETRRLTKDGRMLDVVMWATAFSRYDLDPDEIFVLLRDITEEKRIAAHNRTIMRISIALPEYPELESLMDYISSEVKELLGTEGALVLLYDEIREDIFFLGASYDDSDTEERVREVRFSLDQVLAGKVIKTGKPAIDNQADQKIQYRERDRILGYITRTLAVVPIKSEGRIIGALCGINKKMGRFDDNDVEQMNVIAGTVAISIENARFSDEIKKAYREMAAMNRAKDKAINHLSHELKTPVAILTGTISSLRKSLEKLDDSGWENAMKRVERNLNRIVEIQSETADIMENREYASAELMKKMLDVCQDELETLVEQNLEAGNLAEAVREAIDRTFGPVERVSRRIDPAQFLPDFIDSLKEQYAHRDIETRVHVEPGIPEISIPEDILGGIVEGLIKNAVENTPDKGYVEVGLEKTDTGAALTVKDSGVGIREEYRKSIFDGFFSTQDTLNYSTKTPYEFNAGGKGADLLRMKIFSDRFGFSITMESVRCRYLLEHPEESCPGDTGECRFCTGPQDCHDSGHTIFTVVFPAAW